MLSDKDFNVFAPTTIVDGSIMIGVDATPPYTAGHDPAPDATGVPIDTNITVHVMDDGTGVNINTIAMTMNDAVMTPEITGTPADYTLIYDPPADFSHDQLANVTIDASDLAGNSMLTDAYSFTTESVENVVYLNPEHSSAPFCGTAEVGIWVNATEFQGGQMSITYPSSCANVTDWSRNGDDFPMGTSTHAQGSVWITFVANGSLTGNLIGTLTIHCVGELGCTAPLTFVEPSLLSNSHGQAIEVNWMDGTFTCVGLCGDVAPYPGGDGIIDIRDVTLLLNHVGYPGMYPLCEWCGDVAPCPAGDGIIDMRDVVLLLNHVGDPESYPLCCNER